VLKIYGNFTNNGTVNFNNTGLVNLNFKGNTNKKFTGTNAAASTNLNFLTIDKGNNQTPVLEMDLLGTLSTLSNNWLYLNNGTFRLMKAGQTITLTNNSNTFTIPASACLSVNSATAIINIGNNANDASDVLLNGKLEVKSGTVNIGQTGFTTTNQDIEYASAGNPEISIETGGVLYVNGQVRNNVSNNAGALIYNQTGGSLIIGGRNPVLAKAKFSVYNPGSIFNMSGGTITLQRGAGTTYSDFYYRPASATVTGGTLIFDATGQGNQSFKLDADQALYNLEISGTAGNLATVNL